MSEPSIHRTGPDEVSIVCTVEQANMLCASARRSIDIAHSLGADDPYLKAVAYTRTTYMGAANFFRLLDRGLARAIRLNVPRNPMK